jgi:metallo-beta-lactamase class B
MRNLILPLLTLGFVGLAPNADRVYLAAASKLGGWEAPAEPFRVVGPLYFVGSAGLGAWLFTTPTGHILLDTGMPGSGPRIAASIRRLGFKPEDLRLLLVGHAHADHAGGFAYLQDRFGAHLAVMEGDVATIRDGGRSDFQYGRQDAMHFPPARVDRVLRDHDIVSLGGLQLQALHTPGHTRGATTWLTKLAGYTIAFPDGSGLNPGYRLVLDPSYPGIAADFRHTFDVLEGLKPDIWLGPHTETFDLAGKRARGWVDPAGYRRYVAGRRQAFEARQRQESRVFNKYTARP